MFHELRLRPKTLHNRMLFPNEARAILSKACLETGLSTLIDPLIFQRDATGKTISYRWGRVGHAPEGNVGYGACPAVIFGAAKGVIRLYGIGRHGADLVRQQAGLLHQALTLHYDGPEVALEDQRSRCLLEPLAHTSNIYNVRRLVLTKSLHQIKQFSPHGSSPSTDALLPLIHRAIYGGLLSQARLIDQARSVSSTIRSEDYLPTLDELDLDVLAAGQARVKPIKPGVLGIVLDGLTFAMRLNLRGPWFAGQLRSHGYGLIRKGVIQ